SPSYCGVKPQPLATLTISTVLPANSERGCVPPSSLSAEKSESLVIPTIRLHRPSGSSLALVPVDISVRQRLLGLDLRLLCLRPPEPDPVRLGRRLLVGTGLGLAGFAEREDF